MDLIHLADDSLNAEIVVVGGFAHGRLDVCLAPDALDCWSEVLDGLAAGRDASWMDDGRNPEIRFEPSGQDGVVVVAVEDHAASGTSVRVSATPGSGGEVTG